MNGVNGLLLCELSPWPPRHDPHWLVDASDIRRIEDGFYQSTITTWSGERRTVRETAYEVRQMMNGRWVMSVVNRDKTIITNYVYPPIPPRQFDWCAYRDGDEECGPIGWGATKEAAIADLFAMEADGVDEEG